METEVFRIGRNGMEKLEERKELPAVFDKTSRAFVLFGRKS